MRPLLSPVKDASVVVAPLDAKSYTVSAMPITYKEGDRPIPQIKAAFTDCRTCGDSAFYIQGRSSFEAARMGAEIHVRTKLTIETEDSPDPVQVLEHDVIVYQFDTNADYPSGLIKSSTRIYAQL